MKSKTNLLLYLMLMIPVLVNLYGCVEDGLLSSTANDDGGYFDSLKAEN